MTAVIWSCRRHEEDPRLAFRDVRFRLDEVSIDDPDEAEAEASEDPKAEAMTTGETT